MRVGRGYDVRLAGRPSGEIEALLEPEALHIPLWSRRFRFTHLLVESGRRVIAGQPLAQDPANYSMPLVAPKGGTVSLEAVAGHITLEDLEKEPGDQSGTGGAGRKLPGETGDHGDAGARMSEGMRRYKLFALGAWRFMCDVHSGALPDPFGMPKALIVSAARFEPHVARGDVLLHGRLPEFLRGLEHLGALLRVQQIHVVMPRTRSAFATQVREALQKQPRVTVVEVPGRYPHGDLRLVARALGMRRRADSPVWGVGVAGVLAVERALAASRPCVTDVVSIGGPGAREPKHLNVVLGYPLKDIADRYALPVRCRIINGGVLTGRTLEPEQAGVDLECEGLTVIAEHEEREFFSFARPRWSCRSYSGCFLSSLRPSFAERFNTALRGEKRACVSCGFCEEVCPAGIMPSLIHKYLYQDDIEEAEKARLDLCIECGLCSFVCPSKIELCGQLIDAKRGIQRELEAEGATT